MMKPIPKRLLPNSVTYEEYLGNTGEGVNYKKRVELQNVKIEEKLQFKSTSNGKEIVGNARLFYDLVNSSGLAEKPINESKIVFEGHTYHIVDTDVLRADSNIPHHYEVLLK